jgi:hypothetical protein
MQMTREDYFIIIIIIIIIVVVVVYKQQNFANLNCTGLDRCRILDYLMVPTLA